MEYGSSTASISTRHSPRTARKEPTAMETPADTDEHGAAVRWWPRKRLWWTITAAVAALLCCSGTTVYVVFLTVSNNNEVTATNYAGCGNGIEISTSDLPNINELNQEQVGNAAIIIQTGQKRNMPPRAWVIAVATAMQESTLHNYGHLGDRNDHDSLGLFQQRPSQGWGTAEQITDPVYASTSFYKKLKSIDGWETMDLTVAAQAVQRSAFPDAYAKWEPLATDVVNVLTEGGARTAAAGGEAGECATGAQIAASGWTAPVEAGIVSGFRTPQRPDHYGVDLGAKRGTEIRAAASGVVTTAECNASTGNCDVDGSPSVLGCGWYVDIKHANNIITRYCHMVEKPKVDVGQRVKVGQVIGISGSSGNSSGPHLHFEVHQGGDDSNNGAIDPVAWMKQQGIALDG